MIEFRATQYIDCIINRVQFIIEFRELCINKACINATHRIFPSTPCSNIPRRVKTHRGNYYLFPPAAQSGQYSIHVYNYCSQQPFN